MTGLPWPVVLQRYPTPTRGQLCCGCSWRSTDWRIRTYTSPTLTDKFSVSYTTTPRSLVKWNASLSKANFPCNFICEIPETRRALGSARKISLLTEESAQAARLQRRPVLHSLLWLQKVLERSHAIRAPTSIHSDWLALGRKKSGRLRHRMRTLPWPRSPMILWWNMPKSISSISLFRGQDPARGIAGLPTSRMWSLKASKSPGRRRDSPSSRYIVGMIQKTIRPTRTTSSSTTTQSSGDGPWNQCGPSGNDFRARVITSWSDPGRRGRKAKRDVITLEVLNSADEWVTRDEL